MARIGIFSGSFDPVHHGHLMAARLAKNQFELHKVLFIPEASPRGKTAVTHHSHRNNMLELALSDETGFMLWNAAQPSHDISTIADLESAFPGDALVLIMGADVANQMHEWNDIGELKNRVEVVSIARPGYVGTANLYLNLPVSSMNVRKTIQRGKKPYGVPASVFEYIEKHKLYIS